MMYEPIPPNVEIICEKLSEVYRLMLFHSQTVRICSISDHRRHRTSKSAASCERGARQQSVVRRTKSKSAIIFWDPRR